MKHQTVEEVAESASLYALGAMNEEEARLFEAHLAEGCDECAEEVRSFNPVIASLGDCSSEALPSPGVRERLVAFLTKETRLAEKTAVPTNTSSRQMVKIRSSEGEWQPLATGVYRKTLFEDQERGTTTSIIKLEPGAHIPSHEHGGIEECIVLEGDVYSDTESFAAGDYLCMPAGSMHEQLFSTNGALLFIVAGGAATI
jgi:anti-sigma factor ChrR (cupin superfamily)